MINFSRRHLLQTFFAAPILSSALFNLVACESFSVDPGLGALAVRCGKRFGAAIQSTQLNDPAFAAALIREANLLVPEVELKWDHLRPSRHQFNFKGYEKIAAFARAHNMELRGHTLLWHWANPRWLKTALKKRGAAEKILQEHIETVVRKTSEQIREWDLVNEALDPRSGRVDGLRDTLWLRALGENYLSTAFQMAHTASPDLTLVYNEFGLEEGTGYGITKRRAFLTLLDNMQKVGAPIHALGLQSHLQIGKPLGGDDFISFLRDVRSAGLKIIVTELDLDVSRLNGRLDEKISAAQNYTRVYLDMVQNDGSLNEILTWGLSDKYSWLRQQQPHLAGALPLKNDMSRSALWETLRQGWVENGV
jgi:endo-1,4-beta-xylanase